MTQAEELAGLSREELIALVLRLSKSFEHLSESVYLLERQIQWPLKPGHVTTKAWRISEIINWERNKARSEGRDPDTILDEPNGWLSIKEVAQRVGLSRGRIHVRVREGTFPRPSRIMLSDVLELKDKPSYHFSPGLTGAPALTLTTGAGDPSLIAEWSGG